MAQSRNLRENVLSISLFCVPLLLIGCGAKEPAPVPGEKPEQGREFREEDKRAALALSLGSVQALSAETSAYERSLSCSIALESVSARLSDSGNLDPTMLLAIDQARTVYNNRVQQFGTAENKSSAEIAADRLQRAQEIPEQSERGQIAIGCLRAMA